MASQRPGVEQASSWGWRTLDQNPLISFLKIVAHTYFLFSVVSKSSPTMCITFVIRMERI